MHLKMALGCGLALAATGSPALALEASGSASSPDVASVQVLQGVQMQNGVIEAASAAVLQALQGKLNAILKCQAASKFWNGSVCVAVPISIDIANPTISWLPGITVTPDAPTAWTYASTATSVDNGTLGNLHSCEYDIFQRTCGCSADASKPLVTINGSAIAIQPRTCTPRVQTGNTPCNATSPQAYLPGTC